MRQYLIIWICVFILSSNCASKSEHILFIYFTGNILSQITPCGCSLNQTGGLDTLGGLILGQERADNLLFLIAGNSFFPSLVGAPELKGFWALKAVLIYDSLSFFSPAAVLIGSRDLALGWEFIYRLNLGKEAPLLSSNLTFQDGRFLFNQFLIKDISNLRVGIIGLTGKLAEDWNNRPAVQTVIAHPAFSGSLRIKREDPLKAARDGLREIRKRGARFIILLSDLDEQEERRVLSNLSGINLVISGNNLFPPERPITFGRTLTLRPSPRLRSVGKAIVSFTRNRVKISSENIPLSREIPSHPLIREFIQRGELRLNSWQNEFKKLFENAGIYVGLEQCRSCHPQQVQFWKKTRHAQASEALVYSKDESNPDCFFCHNTGSFGRGFLKNVQCEACHGQARAHVNNNKISLAKITGEVCLSCHAPDRFLNFRTEEKMNEVRCPPANPGAASNGCFE